MSVSTWLFLFSCFSGGYVVSSNYGDEIIKKLDSASSDSFFVSENIGYARNLNSGSFSSLISRLDDRDLEAVYSLDDIEDKIYSEYFKVGNTLNIRKFYASYLYDDFSQEFTDFLEESKKDGEDISTDGKGTPFDEVAVFQRDKTPVDKLGSIIATYKLYNFEKDGVYLHRMQSEFELTSGRCLTMDGGDYYAKEATIDSYFVEHKEIGSSYYLESPKPILLDYAPKNVMEKETITSTINPSVTWGYTYPISDEKYEFNSQYGFSYSYSTTIEKSIPSTDYKMLDGEQGVGISVKNFQDVNGDEKTAIINLEMLAESEVASPWVRNNGELKTDVKFVVVQNIDYKYSLPETIKYHGTLLLDVNALR